MAVNKTTTAKQTVFVSEMTENGNLTIIRKPIMGANGKQLITQDGRLYFSYKILGKLRGRDVVVDFSPKDKGGYQPLDLVFDVNSKAELIMTEVVQEMNGVKTRRTVYTAQTVDEDGLVWKAEVKPTRTSDKDMLTMLLNLIGAQVHTVTEESSATE